VSAREVVSLAVFVGDRLKVFVSRKFSHNKGEFC
jgi:hypothetical protein